MEKIDLTDVNLIELAKAAYALSSPQGLGHLHYREGMLSDEEAQQIVSNFSDNPDIALDMDYIQGRACKMTVFRGQVPNEPNLYMMAPWYDHSDIELDKFLMSLGISRNPKLSEHAPACNCPDCRPSGQNVPEALQS